MTSSTGCTDRVIMEAAPLSGLPSEEAICQQYCEVITTCETYYTWERCDPSRSAVGAMAGDHGILRCS